MAIVLQRFDEMGTAEDRAGFGAMATKHGNLPLKQLAYHSSVVALAVRTKILQTYYNPFDQPIEATYIFPIEGQTAVVACEMRVGDRIIRAQLKERGQARADYDRAIRSGHRAALLEENRPETFSMRVGNIPPGEAIQVCIETVTQLAIFHGEWTLRLPLVVAPRYTSGLPLPRNSVGSGTSPDTAQVPDASTITPPTWLPGFASPVDLRLRVDVQLGERSGSQNWGENLKSSLHSVVLDATPSGCRIDILPGERVDRDFILRGRVDDASIRTTLSAETHPSLEQNGVAHNRLTFAINIVPPRVSSPMPRDVVFLLDRSGSMGGWKMNAARRGISRLVDSLLPADRFQVIAFDDHLETFSTNGKSATTRWQIATDAKRYEATRWLSKIDCRGGTEMGLAIKRGLEAYAGDDATRIAGRSLAIVLVTDGQITGEDSVLRLLGSIPEHLRPRLYCLGIDRAVNASVLQRLAAFTGGSFELVESEKRLDEVLKRFAQFIGSPAITKLKIESPVSSTLQLAPSKLDTLYSGRSFTIYGQTDVADALSLTISGTLPNGQAWSEQVFAKVIEHPQSVLLPLWGKSRVRELEDEMVASGTRDPELRSEIIGCSLAYLPIQLHEVGHEAMLS
jgi:Ca-activated chloride channel homolog